MKSIPLTHKYMTTYFNVIEVYVTNAAYPGNRNSSNKWTSRYTKQVHCNKKKKQKKTNKQTKTKTKQNKIKQTQNNVLKNHKNSHQKREGWGYVKFFGVVPISYTFNS